MGIRIFIVLILLLNSFHAFSRIINSTIDTIQVKSEILKENRSIIIYRVEDFKPGDSLTFLYLIDGENSHYRFQKLYERFKDTVANLVGVGIINANRRRDLLYSKEADKFLAFITKELIPVVEKAYKIKTRILFGHSFGGSFTVYSLLKEPNYFNCFIASSPIPIMNLIKVSKYEHADSLSRSKIVLYLSYGEKDMKQVRKWAIKLKDNLTGQRFNNLVWHFKIFEGKTHNNSDIDALIYGFNSICK